MMDSQPTPRRLLSARRAIYGTTFAILVVIVSIPFLTDKTSEWDEVYAAAAKRLAEGENLYPLHTNYTYPPFMAGVAYGVEAFGPTLGRTLWLAINLVAVSFMIRWGWWLAGGRTWPDRQRAMMRSSCSAYSVGYGTSSTASLICRPISSLPLS